MQALLVMKRSHATTWSRRTDSGHHLSCLTYSCRRATVGDFIRGAIKAACQFVRGRATHPDPAAWAEVTDNLTDLAERLRRGEAEVFFAPHLPDLDLDRVLNALHVPADAGATPRSWSASCAASPTAGGAGLVAIAAGGP